MQNNQAMNCIQIDQNTWVFEEPIVRFFLLAGTKRAILIDSGMMTENARELAQEKTELPILLLNTHADMDHIGSNAEFEEFYMHPAEASNFYNTQKRTGKMIPVWDGNQIDLGDRPLQIISLPGHTTGSIAVLDKNNRRLFSGDPVQDGNIFMFGVQREIHAYRHSLLKLWNQRDLFDEIYPSHGSWPLKPEKIMSLYEVSGRILNGEYTGKPEEIHGTQVVIYDTGEAIFLCDREMETFADLYLSGRIEFEEIHRYVEDWGYSDDERTLAQYLGLTTDEEDAWVSESEEAMRALLDIRKMDSPVKLAYLKRK